MQTKIIKISTTDVLINDPWGYFSFEEGVQSNKLCRYIARRNQSDIITVPQHSNLT